MRYRPMSNPNYHQTAVQTTWAYYVRDDIPIMSFSGIEITIFEFRIINAYANVMFAELILGIASYLRH